MMICKDCPKKCRIAPWYCAMDDTNPNYILGKVATDCEKPPQNRSGLTAMKPCPFCKGTNIRKYRFDIAVAISETPGALEIERPYGENYALECDCGCRLVKHMDYLHDEFYSIHDYNIDFTEEMHWDFIIKIWNNRD